MTESKRKSPASPARAHFPDSGPGEDRRPASAGQASRVGWLEVMALPEMALDEREAVAGWPASFTVRRAAVLQYPGDAVRQSSLRELLEADCANGSLPSGQVGPHIAQDMRMFVDNVTGKGRLYRGPTKVRVQQTVRARDFSQWLSRQGLTPSGHVAAWARAVVAPSTSAIAPVTGPAVAREPRWTPQALEELAAYRKEHGTKAAAEKYQISTSFIRRKLPKPREPSVGYSAYTHRPK